MQFINRKKGFDWMAKLTSMRNIGKRNLNQLVFVLQKNYCKQAVKKPFIRLKMRYPNVCLVHLYTLQGAIDDIEYNQLSDKVKGKLKSFSDSFK